MIYILDRNSIAESQLPKPSFNSSRSSEYESESIHRTLRKQSSDTSLSSSENNMVPCLKTTLQKQNSSSFLGNMNNGHNQEEVRKDTRFNIENPNRLQPQEQKSFVEQGLNHVLQEVQLNSNEEKQIISDLSSDNYSNDILSDASSLLRPPPVTSQPTPYYPGFNSTQPLKSCLNTTSSTPSINLSSANVSSSVVSSGGGFGGSSSVNKSLMNPTPDSSYLRTSIRGTPRSGGSVSSFK